MTSEARPPDEIANLLTHGVGFVLSLVATVCLMRTALGTSRSIEAACGIYCLTLVLLYGTSTLSHAFYEVTWRRLFRTLDQASIFLLIAGSFTPIAVIYLDRGRWWLLLAAMWLGATAGVLLVVRMRNLISGAKTAYGILGWLPVVALGELAQRAPQALLMWLITGGVCYSLGAIFLSVSGKMRYAHALWHTCVVAGSACHYLAILKAVRAT